MTDEAIDLDRLSGLFDQALAIGSPVFGPTVTATLEHHGYGPEVIRELLRRARRLERVEGFLREHGASLILACERYPGTREALAALMKEIEK